ncbi:RNA 2',3'-cyclic phosphodiesterase [Rubrobacter xylanophilus DSM 9941]|nr:RNA 2',3'-cyclic phosphodiesterase [Rubrobacter xylanophilus DSM 9941]
MGVDVYERIWRRFIREGRLEFGGYMDPNWRNGHDRSASFIVPVDAANLRERLEPLREALRPFPFVSLHPDHFLHITLVMAGFAAEGPGKSGEIPHDRITELGERARRALSGFAAFEVRLEGLNAFPGAAFVEVHDEGQLERLRSVLCRNCGLQKPPGPPHLTLAYFQAPDGTPAPPALISTIERYRGWPVGRLMVDRVELSLLDLKRRYPPPEPLIEIPLRRANGASSG